VKRAEGLKITYEYFRNLPEAEWSKQPKEFNQGEKIRSQVKEYA
jgi:dTDP-glucose 4,6-dehydratase